MINEKANLNGEGLLLYTRYMKGLIDNKQSKSYLIEKNSDS